MSAEVVASGLAFPEAPRWHDGRLWLSDFYTHRVLALGGDGALETVCEVPGQPSGLGLLADGTMLVVSMTDRRLLRFDGERLHEVADLGGLGAGWCNDLVVDADGRAYVGEFGFAFGEPERPGNLMRVDPDGSVGIAVAEMHFPNGAVFLDGGRTLVVAETIGQRLTAFDVAADGSLAHRRAWAAFAPEPAAGFGAALGSGAIVPDGICLDSEGSIWVADIAGRAAKRVREGGEVLDVVPVPDGLSAYAVALGGADGRTLYVCVAGPLGETDPSAERRGAVLAARV